MDMLLYIAKEIFSDVMRGLETNNLTLYLKELEKEEYTKPKASRKKEKINIRVDTNEIEK